jgi:hypothetical protein
MQKKNNINHIKENNASNYVISNKEKYYLSNESWDYIYTTLIQDDTKLNNITNLK